MSPSVVHVVRSDAFAGVERYILDTANELANRGWNVSVIGGDPSSMRAQLDERVGHRPAATVQRVAGALWSLGRRDIVHAHMTAAELPAAVLKRRSQGRLVVTRHFSTPRGRSLNGRIAAAFIERGIDLQIATSEFVARSTNTRCVVVHNGVRSSDQSAVRARVVVMLHRLEAEKDTATGLRAWAKSGLGREGWRLVIYGKGSEDSALRELAVELGIVDTVDFAGFTADPRAALRAAAILLATAVSDAFGLAVVEAMAEATPVLATRAGAHPETLGKDGAYFPVGDDAECASQMVRLASAAAERELMGARLRTRQRALFSVPAHVDRLEVEYRKQLGRAEAEAT